MQDKSEPQEKRESVEAPLETQGKQGKQGPAFQKGSRPAQFVQNAKSQLAHAATPVL